MMLAPIPGAGRVWALPFLTALSRQSAPVVNGAVGTSLCSTSASTRPPARRWLPGTRRRGGWATAASRPCCSSTRCARPHHGNHPLTAGCCSLRAGPATAAGHDRTPADQRRAAADARCDPRAEDTRWHAVVCPAGTGQRAHDEIASGPPCGGTAVCRSCRSDGCWCAIPRAACTAGPALHRTRRASRRRSWVVRASLDR